MVYKFVSSKEVITRIIRKSKLSNTSYLEDIKVWLPEGINALKTKHSVSLVSIPLEVSNHIAYLPDDLSSLVGILYEGKRLRMSSSDLDFTTFPLQQQKTITSFYTNVGSHASLSSTEFNSGQDIIAQYSQCNVNSYKINLGNIHTSFCEGNIEVIYNKLPVDCEGFLLIPDNTDYKQALEWYVYQQMTFGGYKLPDPRMDYTFCTQEFERFAARALASIKYPSVDKMETTYRSTTNLVFPQHYWEHFGQNLEQIQEIRGL